MNTVWINCHGVLEPHTSFARDSHLVPVNGPDLFEMLMAVTKPKMVPAIEDRTNTSSVISLKEFVAKNDAEALKKVKPSTSLKDSDKISLLRPLQKYISAMAPSLDWVWSSNFGYLVTDSGMQITCCSLTNSPQYISVLTNSPSAVAAVLLLAYHFISRGSALVVRVPLATFMETFERHPPLLDLCKLGFIVFVVHTGDVNSFNLVKNRHSVVLRQGVHGRNLGQEAIEYGIDFSVENLALIPHFSHIFTHSKNVYLI